MAPKGGRGGGGGGRSGGYGSGSSSCPDAFNDPITITYYAFSIVFFLMTLFTMIAWAKIRKRHPHAKKLAGWVYSAALFGYLVGYGLDILATTLRECEVVDSYTDYDAMSITARVLVQLAEFLLLVLVVWVVNKVLRDPLGGRQFLFTISYVAILGLVGCITCAVIGVEFGAQFGPVTAKVYNELNLAYYILFMLASVAGSAISVVTLLALRRGSQGYVASKLLAWVIVLAFSMFFWLLLVLIRLGSVVDRIRTLWSIETYQALAFLVGFFQIFSLIVILHMSKLVDFKPGVADHTQQAYNPPTYTNTSQPAHVQPAFAPQHELYGGNQAPRPQQHYTYNYTGQNATQQNYYNQPPMYNGPPPELKA